MRACVCVCVCSDCPIAFAKRAYNAHRLHYTVLSSQLFAHNLGANCRALEFAGAFGRPCGWCVAVHRRMATVRSFWPVRSSAQSDCRGSSTPIDRLSGCDVVRAACARPQRIRSVCCGFAAQMAVRTHRNAPLYCHRQSPQSSHTATPFNRF